MKFKKIVLFFLILSILVCTCGCALGLEEIERDGVEYEKHNNRTAKYWKVASVGCGYEVPDTVYIPDEIDGIPVIGVGFEQWGGPTAKIWGAKRVYFPWSIEYSPIGNIGYTSEVKYIISASTEILVDIDEDLVYIIPLLLYNKSDKYCLNTNPFRKIDLKEQSNIYPANVAYFFNYEGNPNEGYFFVDWLGTTGRLTKPPYSPKREGYKFVGWYKEAECLNVWDFENDIAEEPKTTFDKDGNIIFNEFRLYAKWEKK
jgi:hypothetical protein